MNSVNMIGRLTADPELKTTEGYSVARFSIAIDKPLSQEKREIYEVEGKQTTDFPRIVVWGNQAESAGKYLKKGDPVGISGRVTTGSYTKEDGTKVFTTDITASRVRFLGSSTKSTIDNSQAETEVENIPF